MINVGIIGCGGIATQHINGYLAIPGEVTVTAASDVAPENAARVASQVGGARTFDDYHVLLAESEVDAVDICLPHHLHVGAIVAAAQAGKHILCEKPLCLTHEEAAAVTQAVQQSGVTLMCAHNQIFSPAVQEAKRLLSDGAIGPVYGVHTIDTFRHLKVNQMTAWRSSRATMGGGELIDTGYHPTYLLLYLVGRRPVEVTALLSGHRLHDMEGEDSAQVLVRFDNGVIGQIETSWAYERPIGSHQFHAIGERGQLYRVGNDLHVQLDDGETTVIALGEVNGFHAEVADFVACLRDKRPPLQSEADGIAVLNLILGAYRSQEERRTITLD